MRNKARLAAVPMAILTALAILVSWGNPQAVAEIQSLGTQDGDRNSCDRLDPSLTDATLVSAIASFHTNDDDKDHDTTLSISVEKDGKLIASVSGVSGEFKDHTDNGPFGLTVHGTTKKSELSGAVTKLTITTVGNDTWRFNYDLDLAFSDGTHIKKEWTGQVLDQDSRSLEFKVQ